MKEKNNNKTYAFIVLGVIGTIILTLGITYAYWRLTKEQIGENVVNTDCFSIDFTGENDITLDKVYPLEDDELESFLSSETPYHFTITNECSSLASATINLESLNTSPDKQLDDEWIDVILYETDYHRKLNEYEQLTLNSNNDENKVITDALHAYGLKTFTLEANEVKDYYLLLYMNQETPLSENTQNATWKGKITLSASYQPPIERVHLRTYIDEGDVESIWTKSYIRRLIIEDHKSIPIVEEGQTLKGPFAESENEDYTVQSYLVCNNSDYDCTAYLQGDGKIYANPDSSYLFSNFPLVEIKGLENLDTSDVTDMSSMFENVRTKTLDLSSFDTRKVTSMSYMFSGNAYDLDSPLTTIIFGDNFDTSNVENMVGMFDNLTSLNDLDLSKFNTSKVIYMSYMFENTTNLSNITYGPNFIHNAEAKIEGMFKNSNATPPDATVHSSWEGVSFD